MAKRKTPKLQRNKVNLEKKKILEEYKRQVEELRHDLGYSGKHIDKLWEHVAVTNERLQGIEAQLNLLSRLVTTLCIEKFGIKLGTFKRLIRRIEKEAIADSEISDLQALYEKDSPE